MNELMKTTSTLGVIQESISYFVLFLGAFCGGRGGGWWLQFNWEDYILEIKSWWYLMTTYECASALVVILNEIFFFFLSQLLDTEKKILWEKYIILQYNSW